MATIYTVLRRRLCPECKGVGVVSNPIYAEFHEAEKAWETEHPRPEYDPTSALWREYTAAHERFENDWFAGQGYPGGSRHWPPEEFHCDNCQDGIESSEVPLIEALQAIGLPARCQ